MTRLHTQMDQFAFKSTPAKLDVLRSLLAAHPDATRLDTVSGRGAPVYALVVSEHASSRAFLVPRVQLSAGFPAGAGMLVRFARYLLERRPSDPEVAALLKHTELHLVFQFAGYRSASFHQVCVSDAGSDLVRLLNIDASVRDEASASPAYSGTRSSDRLVLSGVLLTVAPTQAPDELDDKQLPKAPDQDVFSYIATRFAEKQPALGKTECATAANDSASNQRFFNQKVQPNLGALEKHAYAHRGILQSFLTTPCCSNVTKMRALWPETRNAMMDFVLRPSEGVRGYVKKRWVAFPETTDAKERTKAALARLVRIPGVLGCVDGTLIAIQKPHGLSLAHTANYMLRKGFCALNTMIFCRYVMPTSGFWTSIHVSPGHVTWVWQRSSLLETGFITAAW
ncbi:hypothetical protein MTO96_016361 [Rhipicephalus appendiculatus]